MESTSARCSSSDEEAERSAELNESKRVRRRRGRRTRKRSGRDSPSSETNRSPEPPTESRKRTCSLGAPAAPRNTNDFLLEDMEKRECTASVKRVRQDDATESQEELPGEAEFDEEYEESWRACVVDKYKELTHDELARRMAIMEKNRDEVERKLRWERSKSDYLQERLLEAEEQIRAGSSNQEDGSSAHASTDSPPPPVPTSCALPTMFSGSCSPNVISSPRA